MGLSDFVTRWSIRGIARTQFRRFKLTQKKNPWISEQEIAQSIFTGRMSRISTSSERQGRVEVYFDVNAPIQTLREACQAIAVVEFKIHPSDNDNVNFLVGIIDKELDKLGYVEGELKG